MDYHFVDVFGDVPGRLTERWEERGGLAAYNKHVLGVVEQFDHVEVHPRVWLQNVPNSSLSCHMFLHAVQEAFGVKALERAAWALREMFFLHAQDVGARSLQMALAEELDLPRQPIEELLDNGVAASLLSRDVFLAKEQNIAVSPTLVFDGGRQVLRGNVGYRIIEANVQELLTGDGPQHSWC